MCEDQLAFSDLDESFRSTITFSDNSKVYVMGKGNVKICTKENVNQIILNVFFIPDLKTNLLSIGQLQEKGYEVSIKGGICRIQDEKLGMIAQVKMSLTQLFPLYLPKHVSSRFLTRSKEVAWLWHFLYAHLSFGGLQTLHQKNMVEGLLKF